MFFYPVRSYRISAIGVAPTLLINWAAILSEMGLTRFCQWLNFISFYFHFVFARSYPVWPQFLLLTFCQKSFVCHVSKSMKSHWRGYIFLFCSCHQLPFLWSLKDSLIWQGALPGPSTLPCVLLPELQRKKANVRRGGLATDMPGHCQ